MLAGYPLALLLLPRRPWDTGETAPPVTVLIPAYREREALREKLHALRELDYPPARLQVIVAVDDDRELSAIAAETYPEALVLFRSGRAGKAAALSRGISECTGEVVVLTDANNVLHRDSLRAAVRHFADPAISGVAGRRRESGSAYDRYEDILRRLESRSGSVAAMSGEFIAVRRSSLPPLPGGVVNDDLWLLCRLVRDGGRVVYEPEASSTEPSLDARAEVARRSRMGAGRVMLAPELQGLPAGFAWRLLSHKFGRLALPFVVAWMLVSSLGLARRRPYRGLAAAQLVVYGAGGLALAGIEPPGRSGMLARASAQFLLGNAAVAVGVLRAVRGRQDVRWDPVR